MILISGSWLVKDSKDHNDIDIVYITLNLGKYILLLVRKKNIEAMLKRTLNIKVTFSPYFVLSPTVIGNVFLAITLLRYPHLERNMSYLLKLTLGKSNKRWLLIHFAFAILGLLSSTKLRDYIKYCSMIAENLLYLEKLKIPNFWIDTLKMGYLLASKRKFKALSALFLSCIKCAKANKDPIMCSETILPQIVSVVKEYLFQVVQIKDSIPLRWCIADVLRVLHEKLSECLLNQKQKWTICSSIVIDLIDPKILIKVVTNPSIRLYAIKVFKLCKDQIPVLSPLAHP